MSPPKKPITKKPITKSKPPTTTKPRTPRKPRTTTVARTALVDIAPPDRDLPPAEVGFHTIVSPYALVYQAAKLDEGPLENHRYFHETRVLASPTQSVWRSWPQQVQATTFWPSRGSPARGKLRSASERTEGWGILVVRVGHFTGVGIEGCSRGLAGW